jgi:hypothetical protein
MWIQLDIVLCQSNALCHPCFVQDVFFYCLAAGTILLVTAAMPQAAGARTPMLLSLAACLAVERLAGVVLHDHLSVSSSGAQVRFHMKWACAIPHRVLA